MSSGPYRSRLFNFLNRQLVRFNHRLAIAARQTKTAAVWGAQLLVYPLYLLVQAGRVAKYRLRERAAVKSSLEAAEKAERQALAPPSRSDRLGREMGAGLKSRWQQSGDDPQWPISLGALEALALFGEYERGDRSLVGTQPQRERAIVRGIATLLESHTLVLVTADNQVLDVLSPKQRRTLRRRIEQEFGLLPLAGERGNRWEKTLVWVQNSAIARRFNLFNEASLSRLPGGLNSTPDLEDPQFGSGQLARSLDSYLARLETSASGLSGRGSLVSDRATTQPQSLQSVLRAAVDYFFGTNNRQQPQLPSTSTTSDREPTAHFSGEHPAPELAESRTSEPWLSWNDLFARRAETETTARFSGEKPAPEPAESRTSEPWLSWNDLFARRAETSDRETPSTTETNRDRAAPSLPPDSSPKTSFLAGIGRRFSLRLGSDRASEDAPSYGSQNDSAGRLTKHPDAHPSLGQDLNLQTSSTLDPENLEVKATEIGYHKHPLEWLLQWIDLLFVWVEGLALRVWRWLSGWWRSH